MNKVKGKGIDKAERRRQERYDNAKRLFAKLETAKVSRPTDEEVVKRLLGKIRGHSEKGYVGLLRTASDGQHTLDELIQAHDWKGARKVLERLISGTYQ